MSKFRLLFLIPSPSAQTLTAPLHPAALWLTACWASALNKTRHPPAAAVAISLLASRPRKSWWEPWMSWRSVCHQRERWRDAPALLTPSNTPSAVSDKSKVSGSFICWFCVLCLTGKATAWIELKVWRMQLFSVWKLFLQCNYKLAIFKLIVNTLIEAFEKNKYFWNSVWCR